ncbi:hypothetical protein BC834DRAFT_292966 [Gloeopeniophorella convolvens]|nr:hypothetical protein BC834DRAFT_292966 [Gloeopeniophorella convolvens]
MIFSYLGAAVEQNGRFKNPGESVNCKLQDMLQSDGFGACSDSALAKEDQRSEQHSTYPTLLGPPPFCVWEWESAPVPYVYWWIFHKYPLRRRKDQTRMGPQILRTSFTHTQQCHRSTVAIMPYLSGATALFDHSTEQPWLQMSSRKPVSGRLRRTVDSSSLLWSWHLIRRSCSTHSRPLHLLVFSRRF